MIVDVHAHCFPAGYVDALLEAGVAGAAGVRSMGAGDAAAELDARLALMDDAGVDRQILSPSSLVPDIADPQAALRLARTCNDLVGTVVERAPDRFRAFAVLPMSDAGTAIAGLDEALARPGVVGVAVATSVGGRSIADPAFDDLFAELDRRSTVLFIHPAGRAAEWGLIRDLGFEWLVGAPMEAGIAVTHLVARGIPSRFPRLRLVLTHLGGDIPMLLQRLDNQFPRAVPDAPEPPSAAVRRMWFDTVAHGHPPALVAAVASFGADRLVLGTDYPYVRGPGYRRSVEYTGDVGLSSEEHEAILGANALALLGASRGPTSDPATGREGDAA